EWDQATDAVTGLRLQRYFGNQMLDLHANLQVNDFFQETEQLPSLEHYWLGGALGNWLSYSSHSKIAYSRLRVADAPVNPVEAAKFTTLPGEVESRGVVATTQQRLDLPLQLGPLKVVPNVSGAAEHYGEAADGDQLTRLTGQAGVGMSLMMWRIDPTIESSLLNIRGLAHKAEWSADYFYADSDTNLDELPLYDPLDDNAQEQFRRRFTFDTFGGALPAQFDPRTYSFRHGLQRLVTNPSDVVADDLQQFRLGLNQRFQTKRGLPGRERIVDLFRLDLDTILFPNADDNFGETVGPTLYDASFHVGDRVTLLSDGYFDWFDNGLRSISAGVRSSRPGVGDFYVGFLSLEGPISSNVVRTSADYRLNEKWLASASMTYDFGNVGNVGQSYGLMRIGESFLFRVEVNVDSGRDNTGFKFLLEPRFFPSQRRGRIGGQLIPPPGAEGLE
ncbi:MAG: organic solvent tolerance protein OstA, partial [Planctomycetota bacterium]